MSKLQKKDIIQVFGIIRAVYKSAFNFTSEDETEACIGIWYDILAEYSKELVFAALKSCIRSSEFEPKPATLVKECDRLLAVGDKSDIEYWHELTKAIDECYMAIMEMGCSGSATKALETINDTYNKLGECVQVYCGNVWGFIELAKMDKETLGYEKGRFLKQVLNIKVKAYDRAKAKEFMKLTNIGQLKLGGVK